MSIEKGDIQEGLEHILDTIWLACAIDGEGCVSLCKGGRWFSPQVHIANTQYKFVEEVSRITGEKVISRDLRGNRKRQYYVKISDQRKVVALLQGVLPFLVIKRRQAELLVEWCTSRQSRIDYHTPPTKRELEIVEELHELNKKGVE